MIFLMLSVKPLCNMNIVLLPFSAILFCLFFMYLTLLHYCLLLNLFVICLYFCSTSFGGASYVPGGTHTQWRYSIMVCIILLLYFTFRLISCFVNFA